MTNKQMEVEINSRFKLICEPNIAPYDKEFDLYVVDTSLLECQDIARISPTYNIDKDGDVSYDSNKISIKLFTDENNEDFTKEHLISIRHIETSEELSPREILKIEEIKVEQNIHNISQRAFIDLNKCIDDGKINLEDSRIYSFFPATDYRTAHFDYNVIRKGRIVLECVSSQEVKSYILKVLKEYKK